MSPVSSVPVRIDPGSVIGPYVVERRLAQGGMSVLYLAHDTQLGRDVVLKMIPDELATTAARARLMREARALASVDHPGVVRVFGTGEYDGTPWIAMEYVRGTDLKRLVTERGPVPPERALRWIVLAAEALVAAHDAGVIHRDLKPSNLLLTPEDTIKIVDFGIAKRRAEPQPGDVLTSQRELLGTPAYLSPEQLEHGLADERSDVWALGCVLYELCVGAPPFGRGGSATTTAAILRDEPIFPPHVTGAVMHIISGCLRKNSFARIGSPRELATMARDALGNPTFEMSAGTSMSSRPVPSSGIRPSDLPPRTSPRPGSTSRIPLRASENVMVRRGSTPPPRTRSSGSIRAAARVGRIKGTAIRAGLAWYAHTFGEDALMRIYDLASPELKGMLRPHDPAFGVIASGWYDTALVGELLEGMEQTGAGDDVEAYLGSLTAAIAKDNVHGIYKSLFRLIATPSLLEANAQRIWRTYCDEGTMTAKAIAPGQLTCDLRGWTSHHATVCKVVGFLTQNILRSLGYTAIIIERTACVADGAGSCVFEGLYLV